jgi:hypothetical protein
MDKFSFYSIKWIRTEEFGTALVPIMYFDGVMAYTVNQWLFSLMEEGSTPSRMELATRAIGQLFDFHTAATLTE